MKRLLLILAIIGLMITGCNENEDTPIPSSTATITPTEMPTPTTSPEPTTTPTPSPSVEPTPTETPTITPEISPSPPTSPIKPPSSEPVGQLSVHFIDVGQGDAILADLGETEVLIDGGGRSPGVVDYLQDYVDGPIEVMVATHPHADHIGGLIEVLEQFEVNEIWHNGDKNSTKTYADFMNEVEAEGADVHIARLHDTIECGELSFYVHHPAELVDSTNNNSIVLHLQYGETDFLFTGDAEQEAEEQMMMLSSVRVPEVEVLKVGHHASRTASSLDFLQITSPEVAIYMAKEDNSYGHPHEETIDKLLDVGAVIMGTDVNGTIIVHTNGSEWSTEGEKGTPLPLFPSTSSPTPSATAAEPANPTPSPTVEATLSDEVVEFPDPNLETVIREIIEKPIGNIYQSDLQEIMGIMAQGRGIVDLTGLEYCTRLYSLDLGQSIPEIPGFEVPSTPRNYVNDISPLANLTQLKTLYLAENEITDLSPLANLSTLVDLRFESNHISDISALSTLTNLKRLYLHDNEITDLTPLSQLPHLSLILLDDNNISDISPLLNIGEGYSLEVLDLSGNPLSNKSLLVYIPELEQRGVTVIVESGSNA